MLAQYRYQLILLFATHVGVDLYINNCQYLEWKAKLRHHFPITERMLVTHLPPPINKPIFHSIFIHHSTESAPCSTKFYLPLNFRV